MRPLLRLLAFVLVLGFAGRAGAGPAPAVLTNADRADIARVERYLNEVHTLRAHFLQVADNGNSAGGTFMMARPGKMKLAYDPPIKDYVVSDGFFVFYWDAELQQQSSQPLGASLADFVLRETIKLSGDVTVTKVTRPPGALEISIIQTDDAGKGELTLVFEDKPLRLHKWRVLDAQGLITSVALSDIRTGVKFEDGLFIFHDPNLGKRRK
ncbi:MAG: outer membrane lipoprotein carrier protein LolA [Rhodospirillaceae bacterium]